jgi:hypothetical protein
MMKLFSTLAVLAIAYVLDQALGLGDGAFVMAALASFAGHSSYDMSTASPLDLSNELSAILLADTMLLGRIGVRGEASQVDHYWLEESLNAVYITAAEPLDSSETTFDVSTGDGAKVQVGTLLMDEAIGKQEVLQVTAISSDALTVVRGFGDSAPAGEAHDDATTFRIIARPKQEGDENVTDETVARSRKHNVCQIFKKEYKISNTANAINRAGVPNEVAHQLAMRMLELKRELEQSILLSVKSTSSGAGGSDSVYRSMDGIRNFVRAQSSQLITTSEALSEGVVNKLYRLIYNQGGECDFANGAADQLTAFSEIYKDKVRLAPSDRMRGVYVTKFLTDLGVELDLLVNRWSLKGDLILGDSKRISLMPLSGRAIASKPLKESGDALIGMMVGEYTLEVRNAGQCFALHSGLQARG